MTIALIVILILIAGAWTVGLIIRRRALRRRLKRQGREGETAVSAELAQLRKKDFRVFDDILLPAGGGGTMQIDHLVVSTRGVFVIETKSHVGYVRGYEHGEYWHQFVGEGKRVFYNPLLQNESHLKGVRRLVGDDGEIPFVSMVVFTQASGVDIACDDHVRHRALLPARRIRRTVQPEREVKGGFLSFISGRRRVVLDQSKIVVSVADVRLEIERRHKFITREEMVEIARRIRENVISDRGVKREHVATARRTAQDTEKSIKGGVCPRCGGRLRSVERGGYRSYLCSNFPDCRFSCDI